MFGLHHRVCKVCFTKWWGWRKLCPVCRVFAGEIMESASAAQSAVAESARGQLHKYCQDAGVPIPGIGNRGLTMDELKKLKNHLESKPPNGTL